MAQNRIRATSKKLKAKNLWSFRASLNGPRLEGLLMKHVRIDTFHGQEFGLRSSMNASQNDEKLVVKTMEIHEARDLKVEYLIHWCFHWLLIEKTTNLLSEKKCYSANNYMGKMLKSVHHFELVGYNYYVVLRCLNDFVPDPNELSMKSTMKSNQFINFQLREISIERFAIIVSRGTTTLCSLILSLSLHLLDEDFITITDFKYNGTSDVWHVINRFLSFHLCSSF